MIQALFEPRTEQQAEFLDEERRKRTFNRRRGPQRARPSATPSTTSPPGRCPMPTASRPTPREEPVTAGEPLTAPPRRAAEVSAAGARTPPTCSTRARWAPPSSRWPCSARASRWRWRGGPSPPAGATGRSGPSWSGASATRDAVHERLAALAEAAGVEAVAVHTAWTEQGPDLGSADHRLAQARRASRCWPTRPPTRPPTARSGSCWSGGWSQPFTALRAEDVAAADLSRYDVIVLPDGVAGRATRSGWATRDRAAPHGLGEGRRHAGVHAAAPPRWPPTRRSAGPRRALLGPRRRSRGRRRRSDEARGRGEGRARDEGRARAAKAGPRPRRRREPSWRPSGTLRRAGGAAAAGDGADARRHLRRGPRRPALPGLRLRREPAARARRLRPRARRRRPAGATWRASARQTPLLSGFAWPEAAARLRGAAYLIDEPQGRGHVILFADDPNFRNFWRGLEKLFTNALLLRPSL